MSDKDSKYELDDELLSAYLDGELSAEDRSAVAARLASDPSAQQLLHELRSVSQDVQSLPQEKLQRDLRESVIHRALQTKQRPSFESGATATPVAPDRPPVYLGDVVSKMPLFHSRRAWIWASLALAAGLLIMIVQRGDESANKLPPVAVSNQPIAVDQRAAEMVDRTRHDLTISAAPESPPPARALAENQAKEKLASPAATTPSEPTLEPGDRTKKDTAAGSAISSASPALKKDTNDTISMQPTGKPLAAASSSPVAPGNSTSTEHFFVTPLQTPNGAGAVGGSLSRSAATRNLGSTADGKPRLVVNIVATREALKNKSFDQLLARHSIDVESEPAKREPTNFSGRIPVQEEKERAANRSSEKAAENQNVDMVLVEASPSAIMSCLAGLKQDAADYLAVEIDPQPHPQDGVSAGSSPAIKPAEDLRQYNRGAVKQAQKASPAPNVDFDYLSSQPNEYGINDATSGGFADAARTDGRTNARELSNDKSQPQFLGRARRVQTRGLETRLGNEQPASVRRFAGKAGTAAAKTPAPARKVEGAKPPAGDDKWKVLFVLTPEDAAPAPSTSPTDRAK